MKQFLCLLFAATIAMLAVPSVASASVNNFTITNYTIDYTLSKDAQNVSTLRTFESITTDFPNTNQNHGIERAIPTTYDGHKTNLKIVSVTDEAGAYLTEAEHYENGNIILRIGEADAYVHGSKTYLITYDQQYVTRHFGNTQSDEFYWDTNGTDWRVPINHLSVRLHVNDSLKSSLNGNTACYQGLSGSTNTCKLEAADGSFATEATQLNAGENVTLAVGFKSGTFAAYTKTFGEKLLQYFVASNLIGVPIAIIGIVLLAVRAGRWNKRTSERHTVINEFLPPKDISITTAAALLSSTGAIFTAQLLDLAVRGYLKIYQTREKSFFKRAEYDIEITQDVTGLKAEEREIVQDIFNGTTVGTRLPLKSLQRNTTVALNMMDNPKKLRASLRSEYGLQQQNPQQSGWFKRIAIISLVLAIITLNIPLLVLAVIAYTIGLTLWPLSDTGLAAVRYLDGLKQYISVAEVDRLKALQSPEGALKISGTDPNDPAQLVKLYEKVLPYAVLFGLEKDWNKQLGRYYETLNTSPDWYSSTTAFNAIAFSSAMNSFSTAASYSSAASSSSGGSSGGGSSGGGGGGGGGGGW